MCTCEHERRLRLAYDYLDLSADEIIKAYIAHDSDCPIYRNECCACDPDITLQTHSGELQIDCAGLLMPNCVN